VPRSFVFARFACLPALLASCSNAGPARSGRPLDPGAYEQEIAAWRSSRVDAVAGPDGWTTLAGLFWLESGRTYRVGDDPTCEVTVPRGHAPGLRGALVVGEDAVHFTAAPGAGAALDGAPLGASPVALRSDRVGAASVLSSGSVTLRVIERGGRLAVRMKDARHPLRSAFAGLSYFPLDPAMRVEAKLEPPASPKKLRVLNRVGQTEEYPSPGTLVFSIGDRECRLDAAQEPGKSSLFILFRDATSQDTTYPMGRFLEAAAPDADGRTILDFNRAYNPPCAFTDFATCPIPPAQNDLPFAVRAGERRYAGPHPGD
jgi:uncharacterized protein (DUF1684 family)